MEFDYFRSRGTGYIPRTANAALRGIEAQILPLEAYVYQGTSLKPLDEEPYDLEEIAREAARAASRAELGIDTNLLLMAIFRRLLKDPEPETALLAAESINAIEKRYSDRIGELKEDVEGDPARYIELAQLYYDLFKLCERGSTMGAYYLREAFNCLKKGKSSDPRIVELTVRILLGLNLAIQATSFLGKHWKQDPSFLLLAAEVAFATKDYDTLYKACVQLKDQGASLDEEQRQIVDQWVER